MIKLFKDYKIAVYTILIFSLVGIAAWIFRSYSYFIMFFCIGLVDATTRVLIIHKPKLRQFFRLSLQFGLTIFLFGSLSLIVGINFQFSGIFFDLSEYVITGAIIQFIVARLVLPFFAGNAFCSRVCWDGMFFEFTNSKSKCKKEPKERSNLLAWGFMIFVIFATSIFAYFISFSEDLIIRRSWILGENILIMMTGLIMSSYWGSRAYCRLLCPFLTISGLISPVSLLKITPVKADECVSCSKCNIACPMYIDVLGKVKENKRVNDRVCILCERCVSVCDKDVLKVSTRRPKRTNKNI